MHKIEYIIVLIVSLVVAVAWVSSDLIKSSPQGNPAINVQSLLQPVDSNFDSSVLNKIDSLPTPAPTTAPNASALPVSPSSTPAPSPTPTSSSTPSATQSALLNF